TGVASASRCSLVAVLGRHARIRATVSSVWATRVLASSRPGRRARRAIPWGRLGHPAPRSPLLKPSTERACLSPGGPSTLPEVAMRTKRSAFLALVASITLGHAAVAADLGGAPRSPINEAPLAYGPAFSWTGPYIGAHIGYGWSDVDWQFADTPGVSTSHGGTGGLLGGQIGYNIQVRQSVFGMEADLSSAWLSGSTACPDPMFNCSHSFNSLAPFPRPPPL